MPGGNDILVVDDDASIRFLCRVNLELEGFGVREAATLDEAREALGERQPAVVVLDLHVGPDSGWDLLTEIRQEYPEVRVVLLSGSVELTGGERELADGVLPKPFPLELLSSTIRRFARV